MKSRDEFNKYMHDHPKTWEMLKSPTYSPELMFFWMAAASLCATPAHQTAECIVRLDNLICNLTNASFECGAWVEETLEGDDYECLLARSQSAKQDLRDFVGGLYSPTAGANAGIELTQAWQSRKWISVDVRLPDDETPVLILINGSIEIGELRWDHPGWEDTYDSYRYWDSPNDDGKDWDYRSITHWMMLPCTPIPSDE